MIAPRSRWEPYLPLVRSVAAAYGVPVPLVLGVIQVESNFDPNAYRAEPQINDASRGLMQLLLKTARGLGFAEAPDLLFQPAINVKLGVRLLAGHLAARHDVAKALSQYNGGYRPALGFGEPLASGVFRNQAYVDKVLAAQKEFAAALLPLPTVPGTIEPADPAARPAPLDYGAAQIVVGMIAALGALWFFLWRR